MDSTSNETPDGPFVTVTITPDGQMQISTSRMTAPNLWAAGRLLELMGDANFTEDQKRVAATRPQIVTPRRN